MRITCYAMAQLRYVADCGDDAADGLTADTAWATLLHAANSTPDVPKAELRLLVGSTWHETLDVRGREHRLLVRGWGDGEMPVIDCQGVVEFGVHADHADVYRVAVRDQEGTSGIKLEGPGVVARCEVSRGRTHHILTKSQVVSQCVFWEHIDPGVGSNAYIVFFPEVASGKTFTALGCVAVGDTDGHDETASNLVYSHSEIAGDTSECLQLIDCHVSALTGLVGGITDHIRCVSCTGYNVRNYPRNFRAGDPTNVTLDQCAFLLDPETASLQTVRGTGVHRFAETCFVAPEPSTRAMWYVADAAATLVFDRCVIYSLGRHTTVCGTPCDITHDNTVNWVTAAYNLQVRGTYVGDHNVWYYPGARELRIRDVASATNYETLAAWQSASGQDANSVWLTDTQAANWWVGDPVTGDFRIHPVATATTATGVVVTSFPDGTPFSAVGPRCPRTTWPAMPVSEAEAMRWFD